MLGYAGAFVATAVVFLAIDMLWLTVVARSFYRDRLGDLLLEQPNLWAAAAFYLIYVAGITVLCIVPALQGGNLRTAIINGAVVGFIGYSTYDLTNLATLRGWPVGVALVDIAWGVCLTALSAGVGYATARHLA